MEKTMYKPNHPIEYMRFKVFVKSQSRQFKKASVIGEESYTIPGKQAALGILQISSIGPLNKAPRKTMSL